MKKIGNKLEPYLLIAPAFLYMGIFLIYPIFLAIKLSFTHPLNPDIFPTLATWKYIFRQTYFFDSINLTSFYALITITLETFFGLMLAILLHKNFRGRGIIRSIVILPMGIPLMVGAVSIIMVTSDSGILKGVFWDWLGWIGEDFSFEDSRIPVIFAEVWKTTPFCVIIILAGLEGIPSSVYDAAKTLGANGWQQFWKITLPLAWPAVVAAFIIRLSEVFKMFTFPYLVGKAGQKEVLSVWAYRMYEETKLNAANWPQSRASAFALLMVGMAITYLLVIGGAVWAYKNVKAKASSISSVPMSG